MKKKSTPAKKVKKKSDFEDKVVKIIKRPRNWENKKLDKPLGRGMGSGAGVRRKIETPDKLWELFEEYKIWSKANPYLQHVGFNRGKKQYIEKERVVTFIGFEGWLCERRIIYDLTHYEKGQHSVDYRPIIREIKRVCSNDTITGASAGVYNANIASRLEGLTEKQEVKVEDNRKEVADLFPLDDEK